MSFHLHEVNEAVEFGLEGAIMIQHFRFWIEFNKRAKRNFYEGRTWMYQTQREMAVHFPYWNRFQILRIIDNLVQKGVLRRGNFNKNKFDKTTWYAFENEEIFTKVQKCTIEDSEMHNPECESAQPIPDNIPDNIPDDKAPPPKPPPKKDPDYQTDRSAGGAIKYFNGKGEEKEISESDIFKHFLKFKYPTAIVEEAMEIAKKEPTPINNILKFLEAICLRIYKNIKIPQDILSISEPEKIKEVNTCNLGDLLYGKKPIRKPI